MGKKKNKKNKVQDLQGPTRANAYSIEYSEDETVRWDSTKYSRKPVIIPLETFEALHNSMMELSIPNYHVFMSVSLYSIPEVNPDHPVDEPGSPTHMLIFCMKLIQSDQFNPLGVVQIDMKKNQTDQLVTVWKAFIQDLHILGIIVVATISPASELFHLILSKLTEIPNLHEHNGPIIYSAWPCKEIIHLYDYQYLMEEFQDTFCNRVDLYFINSPGNTRKESYEDSDMLKYFSACWTDILITMTTANISCVYTQEGLGSEISIFGSKFKHCYERITKTDPVATETKRSTDRLMSLLCIYDDICWYNIDMSIKDLRDFYAKSEEFRIFLSSAKFRTIGLVNPDFDNPSIDSTQTDEKSSFGLAESDINNIMQTVNDSIDRDNEIANLQSELPLNFDHDYLCTSSGRTSPLTVEARILRLLHEYSYPESKIYEEILSEENGEEFSEFLKEFLVYLKRKNANATSNHFPQEKRKAFQNFLAGLRQKAQMDSVDIEATLRAEITSKKLFYEHVHNKNGLLTQNGVKVRPIEELLTQIGEAVKSEPKNDVMITHYDTPKIFGHTCDCCEKDDVVLPNGFENNNCNRSKECCDRSLVAKSEVSCGSIKDTEEDFPTNINELIEDDLKELKASVKNLEDTEQASSNKFCNGLSGSSSSLDSLDELYGTLKEEEPSLDVMAIACNQEVPWNSECSEEHCGSHSAHEELQGLMEDVYGVPSNESAGSDQEVEENMNRTKRREVVAKIVSVTGQKVIDKELKNFKSATPTDEPPDKVPLDYMQGVETFKSPIDQQAWPNDKAPCTSAVSNSIPDHSKPKPTLPHYTRFNHSRRSTRSSDEDSSTDDEGSQGSKKDEETKRRALSRRRRAAKRRHRALLRLKPPESYETIESNIVASSSPNKTCDLEEDLVEIDYSQYRTSLVNQLTSICDEKKSCCDNIFKSSLSKLFESYPSNAESMRVTTDWMCTLKGYAKLADVLEERRIGKIRSKVLCLEHVSLYVAMVKKLRFQRLDTLRDKTAKSFLDFECSFNVLLSMSGVFIVKDPAEVEEGIGQDPRV